MCSLASCNTAFEDCKDDDGFDLGWHSCLMDTVEEADCIPDAVWQLVGLSAWAVGFVEKLVKECILSSDLTGSSEADDDLFESCAYLPLLG